MNMPILTYIATPSDEGKTAETILKKKFGVSSKLMIQLKLNGRLKINDTVCRSVDTLSCGDVLTADISENLSQIGEILPTKIDINIVYEDEYIMVVNKCANLESHPSLGNFSNTLANAVMYYWQQNGEYHNYHIVNRLDKDTSGLCVIAKNRYTHSVLSEQIRNKVFSRKYTAIVHGTFSSNEGIIEKPIKRDPNSIIRRIVAEDGQYAKTNYKIISAVNNKYSIAEIELETGRTHQIRVHFSSINHPLVGDWLYGSGDEERHLINRQALNAGYLAFNHPATQKRMVFEAPIPNDMNNLIKLL